MPPYNRLEGTSESNGNGTVANGLMVAKLGGNYNEAERGKKGGILRQSRANLRVTQWWR